MSSIAIYTVNLNNYDVVHPPRCVDHSYFCFTDAQSHCPERGAWKPVLVEPTQKTPQRESRWHKLHSHRLFPHAEWTAPDGTVVHGILNIPITSVSAFVLLMSSVAMVIALDGVVRNHRVQARLFLFLTAILGLLLFGLYSWLYEPLE